MRTEPQCLHVVLFPLMAHGHMIPTLDIARLLAGRNVKSTIITTPVNAPTFTKAIGHGNGIKDSDINVEIFAFPTAEVGLPDGCENMELASGFGMTQLFFHATRMLQEQLEVYLEKVRPDCLVADMLFPWATESAAKFSTPRLVFHGSSYFALCVQDNILRCEPFKNVSSDDEPCTISPLPDEVKLLRTEIPEELWRDKDNEYHKMMEAVRKSELESYGVIVNSFYELEPDYAEFFRGELGRKAWQVGPVSLCNRSVQEKGMRGKQASVDEDECLKWLDSKEPSSVIYICFGSSAHCIAPQLHEIAVALESSKHNFMWVVRKDDAENNDDWLPTGFEERMAGKGLVIRGWAPQVLILGHEAVGAFVTHCGWNSTLEGITAGVPMVTWPMFAEQFYNQKHVTQILQTGVSVGKRKWSMVPSVDDVINREIIEKALREIMEGENAEKMRRKSKELQEMAWNAVAEGGSSHSDLSVLIDELRGEQSRKLD